MRVCIEKTTGKLIESQDGGHTQRHLDILIQNAVASGYAEAEIEVKYVTKQEYADIVAANAPDPPTNAEIYDKTMQNNKLLKAMAISLNQAGAFSSSGVVLANGDLRTLIKENM